MPHITRTTPYFAPDGFASHPQRDDAGLKYAVAASVSTRFAAEPASSEASRQDQHFHNQDGYDEGLVHSHGWACAD